MENILGASVLAAILKNDKLVDARRQGLFGVDLLREQMVYTPWERIKKIIIDRDTVTLVERTWTLTKNSEGKIVKLEYVPEAVLVARKESGAKDSNGRPMFTETGEYQIILDLPKFSDKRDPRVITVWNDIQGCVILWARQSHEFARLRDKRPVYNLDIPEFEFKFKQSLEDIEGLQGYHFEIEEYKNEAISNFTVRKTYGTKEELLAELQEIVSQAKTNTDYAIKKPVLVLDAVNHWTSVGKV